MRLGITIVRLTARQSPAAIYPEIVQLEITLRNTRKHFDLILESVRGTGPSQSIGASVLNGQIDIPPLIDRNVERLFMLGEPAGPSCLQLVNTIFQFNSFVAAMAARSIMMDLPQWERDVDKLLEHLQSFQQIAVKCKQEVALLRGVTKE
jgi:hypothetical protein